MNPRDKKLKLRRGRLRAGAFFNTTTIKSIEAV